MASLSICRINFIIFPLVTASDSHRIDLRIQWQLNGVGRLWKKWM